MAARGRAFRQTIFLLAGLAIATPARAALEQSPPLAALARASERVVRATVTATESAWEPSFRVIVTRVNLEPRETLLGAPSSEIIRLQVGGGTVGDRTLLIPGLPHFERGEEVVLFLRRERGYTLVTGARHGKLHVVRDVAGIERVVSGVDPRRAGLKWRVGEPEASFTLDELRSRLARERRER